MGGEEMAEIATVYDPRSIEELMRGSVEERCEAVSRARTALRFYRCDLAGKARVAANASEALRRRETEAVAAEKQLAAAIAAVKEVA
jgi:hypothetical protein